MQIQFKLLTLILLLFCSGTIFAQSLSIVGGGNYTEVDYKQGDVGSAAEDTYNSKFGFHVGAYLDYVLSKDKSNELVVETGLLLDTKGAKQEVSVSSLSVENNINLYYADIPFYLKYRYRFRSLNKVYIGVGPFVGVGLFGNRTTTQTIDGVSTEEKDKIRWGSDETQHDMRRLDYGLTGRIGFLSVGGLDISASYDYGIPNIASMGDNIEMKSRVMRLSVGYHFSLED